MTVPTFTSTQTDPAGRGRAFGTAWRDAVRATFAGYTELFHAAGATTMQVRSWSEQGLARTAAWAPSLAEEITGIGAGAGLEPWQVGALNARTEILAATRTVSPGECSTAVVLPDGGGPPRTIQTWDWHDHLRHTPVVWELQPRPGHHVRTFTEFGVLGKIGVNSAGLGIHFNILQHASDHAEIGVPVHVVARRILDEATGVEDAVRIARSARTSASTAFTVATFDGGRSQARALELCPRGLAELPADADGVLLHTNHFLDPDLAAGERLGTTRPGTYARLEHLRARAPELGTADPTGRARVLRSHAEDGAPVCAHPNPGEPFHLRWETLATISLDVAAGRLHVHQGGPCGVRAATWQAF